MTLEEVIVALCDGSAVRWVHDVCRVTRDKLGQYHITFQRNQSCIGLTNQT